MAGRGRGAYRKEDRARIAPELQKELVERAAARYGTCERLARALGIPKSSVHYYRIARLTIPVSLLEKMLEAANDEQLERRVRQEARIEGRTWANAYAGGINRDLCRERVRLPTDGELERDDGLRRKAAAIVSYVMAEGSIWTREDKDGESVVNITFADHETDLYEHFRSLCRDVFSYDIGPPQAPGNNARAIRGFIYSRFVAEWLVANGVPPGEKAAQELHLPRWVMGSPDEKTWVAALQPWCDGEGTFSSTSAIRTPRFSVSQSRHTDLDFHVLPYKPGWRGLSRMVSRGKLREVMVYNVPVLAYCAGLSRSEILDDIAILIGRLGLRHWSEIVSLYLKDDGAWSCTWNVFFPASETDKILRLGLVTQYKKTRAGLLK